MPRRCGGHGPCEALAEEDGELGMGHAPLARSMIHSFAERFKNQEEEFGNSLVAGEMTPGSDCAAQLGIQRLDGVCNRYEDRGARLFGWDRLGSGIWCDHPGRGAPGAR
jgi:hypothetical protein